MHIHSLPAWSYHDRANPDVGNCYKVTKVTDRTTKIHSNYSSLIYYLIPITSFNPIINLQKISFIYKLELEMSSNSYKIIHDLPTWDI
ncbi:unnamed protein product [Rhizophagus irregularis]|nr:unnamed protein product [Rhizophagus irregularis]